VIKLAFYSVAQETSSDDVFLCVLWHPTFHSQAVLKNTFLGTIMTYIYNTLFNTITKDYIYIDMNAELASGKHVLDNPANKVIDCQLL